MGEGTSAALISGAASIASAGAQTTSAAMAGRKSRKLAREENEKSRAFSREMYARQIEDAKAWYNEFESPSALRRQYMSAGFSPYASVGAQGYGMESVGVPDDPGDSSSVANANIDSAKMMSEGLGQIGGSVEKALMMRNAMEQTQSNIRLQDSQANKNNADAERTIAENEQLYGRSETKYGMKSNFEINQMLNQAQIQSNIDTQGVERILKSSQAELNKSNIKVNDATIQKITIETQRAQEEIKRIAEETKYLSLQSKNMYLQNIIDGYTAKLVENGIDPRGNAGTKLLESILGINPLDTGVAGRAVSTGSSALRRFGRSVANWIHPQQSHLVGDSDEQLRRAMNKR